MPGGKAAAVGAAGSLSFPYSDAAQMFPEVYQELRRLAGHFFKDERPGQTLQPTALVNEAYLRLMKQGRVPVHSRPEFFAIAAHLMRRILVDHARGRMAAKRGGTAAKVRLPESVPVSTPEPEKILGLDEAMKELEEYDEQMVRIVELRYFAGCSVEETASVLQISARTVERKWAQTRIILQKLIDGSRQ